MNYLEAKSELLNAAPPIAPKLILIEAVVMVAVAGILVQLFA